MNTKLAAGVLLLAAFTAGSVVAGCGSAKSKAAQPRVLRFLSLDESASGVQRQTPRVGDRFIFITGLYKESAKPSKRIGGGTVICTVTAPGGKAVFCTGAIELPGGYVLVTNFFPEQRKVNTGAVIGGVGAYANARGTATFTVLARKNGVEKNSLVLRLEP